MSKPLCQFLDRLDRCEADVPLNELVAALQDLEVSTEDLCDCIRYAPDCYKRNLLHRGPGYEALILCWKPGQRSPVHDHAGSICGVRVIAGTMTEIRYSLDGDRLVQDGVSSFGTGSVCGSFDADIHEISNLDDEPLVTLHVYAPPMASCHTYQPPPAVTRAVVKTLAVSTA